MKKRKAPVKKAPAKKGTAKKVKAKLKAAKALAPKGSAVKVTGRQWGEGPWAAAMPKPAKVATRAAEGTALRPALEDVFNHQVKRQYAPLQRLRAPRGVWSVRAVLIIIAVLVWIVALFHPFK